MSCNMPMLMRVIWGFKTFLWYGIKQLTLKMVLCLLQLTFVSQASIRYFIMMYPLAVIQDTPCVSSLSSPTVCVLNSVVHLYTSNTHTYTHIHKHTHTHTYIEDYHYILTPFVECLQYNKFDTFVLRKIRQQNE